MWVFGEEFGRPSALTKPSVTSQSACMRDLIESGLFAGERVDDHHWFGDRAAHDGAGDAAAKDG